MEIKTFTSEVKIFVINFVCPQPCATVIEVVRIGGLDEPERQIKSRWYRSWRWAVVRLTLALSIANWVAVRTKSGSMLTRLFGSLAFLLRYVDVMSVYR